MLESTAKELFEEVAKNLKRSATGEWLLTEPHLLYLEPTQAQDYLDAMKNRAYSAGFHSETVQVISDHPGEIISHKTCKLIDLGPGYPDKSLPLGQWCQNNGISLEYFPVDVSLPYLDIARNAMAPFAKEVVPIHCRFEDLPKRERPKGSDVLTMLGLTFMNFEPQHILKLLKRISSEGTFLIASELLDGQGPDAAVSRYRIAETERLAQGPLRLLGIDPKEMTYLPRFRNGRIELCLRLGRVSAEAAKLGLVNGDFVLTAVSYRYTLAQLRKLLSDNFKSQKILLSKTGKTVVVLCS